MLGKAVILFSGGLDSTTCLALAKQQGFECHTLSFDYGQRHRSELAKAAELAEHYGAYHRTVRVDLHQFGGSALTDETLPVPDYQGDRHIPITYVPARNTVFLSLGLALAEVLDAGDIFIGINAVDYSGYPDCRPEYLAAFQQMANLATKRGINGRSLTIHAPLLKLTKVEIIQLGKQLAVDYARTVSCYRADEHGQACGTCDSCVLRQQGFLAANIPDPTHYQQKSSG